MQKLLRQNAVLLISVSVLIASCAPKKEKSSATGWTYNDPQGNGFRVSKEKEQKTGPGLVFVQGGTFTMGATQEPKSPTSTTVNIFTGSAVSFRKTPPFTTTLCLTHFAGVVNWPTTSLT
jgi:formylglycine-generating enzyme required for sulfatase activity